MEGPEARVAAFSRRSEITDCRGLVTFEHDGPIFHIDIAVVSLYLTNIIPQNDIGWVHQIELAFQKNTCAGGGSHAIAAFSQWA